MGIEKESRIRLRRTRVRQVILTMLAGAGAMSIAVLAPNTLAVLGKIIKKSSLINTRSSIKKLLEAGLLERVEIDGVLQVRLTQKGRYYLQTRLGHTQIPRKWDGRWRVVIFDIKEERRHLRARLRDMLEQIGFIKLQNSVWVYPFDCEDLVTLIKQDYRVGKEVLYMIADSIESDKQLRGHYGLR